MKTIDFKKMGVKELDLSEAVNANGGTVPPVTLAWWNIVVTYSKYSMETGGQYVIHHAQ